jgi:hypothetical protein
VKPDFSASFRTGLLLASGPVLGCLLGAFPAAAQSDEAQPNIIVVAPRPIFDIVPERTLASEDVDAYGLGSVGELLDEINAENGDSADDIVLLVNGKRVGGAGSIQDLPPEAIASIEILPVGTGLKAGGSSRQRVLNIRLKDRLDQQAARAGVRMATRGGWRALRGDVTHTYIRGERRVTIAAKLRDESSLLESERDVVPLPAALPGAERFRSLAPATRRYELGVSAADQLAPWLSGAFSGSVSRGDRETLLGPVTSAGIAQDALVQQGRSYGANADLSLNARAGSWLFTFLGNYTYDRRRTLTDREVTALPPVSVTRAISRTQSLGGLFSASGPVIELPAGPLRLTASAGVTRDTASGERRFQAVSNSYSSRLATSTLNVGVDVPIASRDRGVLAFLGDLDVSGEFGRTHASHYGTFDSRTFTLSWRPTRWIRVTASQDHRNSAPPIARLEQPIIETPGVRYFDPLRSETVEVVRITGGNAGLLRQGSDTTRVAATIKPIRSLALQLTAEYRATRSRNPLADLPPASAAIMSAFPERFIRDGEGRLIIVDTSPVNFASRNERQLRTGFNLNLPLGTGRAGSAGADDDEDGDRGAGDGQAGRRGTRPRLQINASHIWLLKSDLGIRAGQPVIDLLSPASVGFGGLGRPRHEFNLTMGYAERGLGLRLAAQHRSASFIEASGQTANVLRFAPLTTFGLRAWIQGERVLPNQAWLKGTRLSLSVQNLTDVRERVLDRTGLTPLSYQPAYRDPIGRTFEIELRKRF